MTNPEHGPSRPEPGAAPSPIGRVLARMDAIASAWGAGDARRAFHDVYQRTTVAFGREVAGAGFLDPPWVERWDVAFANLYLDAAEAWDRGGAGATPGPWAVAFATARDRPELPPLRHILFGLNVHINFDLPQALLAVMTDDDFDDPTIAARRARDHEHADTVLLARVRAEDQLLGSKTLLDRLLTPLNRAGTRRFIAEARAKVWRNARVMSAARRCGPEALAERIRQLESLCAARIQDLVAPGQVLLKLARKGFGVLLPEP